MTAPLLDLALLQTLVAVSQTGTLARAAARVGRTQSAVSLQMQKLEELVAAALFNRQGSIPWRVAVTSPSLGGIWATAAAGMGLTLRSAAAIPAGLLDVGQRFGLPALPTIGVKILEADGTPSPTRQSLRGVLEEIVDELLSNRRSG